MKNRLVVTALILGVLVCGLSAPLPVSAQSISQNQLETESTYVTIDEQHFPDEAFRKYLETLDENHDGKLDTGLITNISVNDRNVKSLKGIEFFSKLDAIYIADTKCTEIDLSCNTGLKHITVWNNGLLKKLDISTCSELEEFDCCYNGLEQLDVSGCPNLIYFECFDNELMYLDVSHNTKLKSLLCSGNHLVCLDISNNPYTRNQINYFENFNNIRYCQADSLDLSTLPGFDISRASEWANAVLDGTVLRPAASSSTVSYTYDVGRGRKSVFVIEFTGMADTGQDDDQKGKNEDPELPQGPDTWVGQQGTVGFVLRLYNVAMGREADEGGLMNWLNKLTTGEQTAAEVAQGFIFSEEFMNKGYNDVQFIKMLYRTMFGREADEGGLNGWVSDLENGMSREYVFHGFAESQEFTNLCASYGVKRGSVTLGAYRDRNKGATGFIARLYTKMLGRKYEDDGLEYWCKVYLTGEKSIEEIASVGFLHSQELANQNLSNEEFVTRMYETFLNREPEEAGLKDWVGRLERGEETRDSLVYGFTHSEEFGNLKAEYHLP